ncbi:hypothetical protein [Nocardioides pacificus]
MHPAPTIAVAVYLAVVAILAGVALARPALERPARLAMTGGLVAVGALVLYDAITLLQGHEPDDRWTHIGYAVASIGVPVLLLKRPVAPGDDVDPETGEEIEPVEPEPPHLAVLVVACVATIVLIVRLQQTW